MRPRAQKRAATYRLLARCEDGRVALYSRLHRRKSGKAESEVDQLSVKRSSATRFASYEPEHGFSGVESRIVTLSAAAENLTRDGLYADAISRAYYAILHAAKAALHVHDIAAESHPAVRRMFGLHLVKPGEIEAEWSACLTAGLDDRLAADYDVETYFSKKETRSECRRTKEFLNRIKRYLLKNGLKEMSCVNGSGSLSDEKEHSTT